MKPLHLMPSPESVVCDGDPYTIDPPEPPTKRVATIPVDAVAFARGAQLDLAWPEGAVIVRGLNDDQLPWVLQLIVEWTVPAGVERTDIPVEARAFRGYRDTNNLSGDVPIPADATYLGTVLDGPSGSLHVYEVNPMSSNYCAKCQCAVKWVRMEITGRAMPIDPHPAEDGTVAVKQAGPGQLVGYVVSKVRPLEEGYKLHRAHWGLCGRIADGGAPSKRPDALFDIEDQPDPETYRPKARINFADGPTHTKDQ